LKFTAKLNATAVSGDYSLVASSAQGSRLHVFSIEMTNEN